MHTLLSIAPITSEAFTFCRVAFLKCLAMRRENTFKIDYSQFVIKPSVEKLYGFCRTVLGLKREDIKRLQRHRGGSCAFVKVSDLALAQQVVNEHDGKHEVESEEGKKHKLRITSEDGSVEVRVHDLPEDVSKEKVAMYLSAFGEVVSIRELSWGETNECEGIPLGVWSARMLLKQNIDSWVSIDGEQAYIVYKGQLQSCRHCKEQAHAGISCVQNKKLLCQKSYANVTKQTGPTNRSTTGQQPPKPAGTKAITTKTVGHKSTAPPPPLDAFPELPKPTSHGDSSGPKTHTNSQSAVSTVSPYPQTLQASNSTSSLPIPPQVIVPVDDVFKKPSFALRSQSKSGNGNETDESSTSTSSRRSRGRPFGKKPRRDDDDEGKEVDNIL